MIRSPKSLLIQGFSMVELLVTICVAAILLAIAAPDFRDAMLNSRQLVETNELMGALKVARSSAITRSTRASVCARSSNTECGTDWNNGFIAFIDNGATPGSVDDGEEILRVASPIESGWLLNSARLVNTSESPLERPYIRFGPRGTSNWRGSGYFAVCDARGDEFARAINISLSGDPRRARLDGTGVLISSFGTAPECGSIP